MQVHSRIGILPAPTSILLLELSSCPLLPSPPFNPQGCQILVSAFFNAARWRPPLETRMKSFQNIGAKPLRIFVKFFTLTVPLLPPVHALTGQLRVQARSNDPTGPHHTCARSRSSAFTYEKAYFLPTDCL